MTPLSDNPLLLLRAMWQRRWIGIAACWAVGLLLAVVVARLPERYEATARVYVDTQSVLRPLMIGLAVQPDVDRTVGMLARNLISRPNMEKVLGDPEVGFAPQGAREAQALVEDLMTGVRLTAGGGQNLFELRYRDVDGERARKVIEKTVALFVTTGRTDKQRDTQEARRFIDEQIEIHDQKLREAENRLKDFKLRNIEVTGATGQDSFARMGTLQDELSRARLDLRAATQSREALQRQLASEEPAAVDQQTGARVSATPETDLRIEAARRQLDDLTRRYTEEHPDVTSTRRLLAQLEADRARELAAQRSSASGRQQATNNPVFQRLRMSLAEAESQVAAGQARVTELQGRLDHMRTMAARYPQVEAELAQLNRDYDIIRRNYDQLAARRESATMSQDVDANSGLASFRVIEPPHVLPKPVFPNRMALAALALLLAIAAGVGASFLAAQITPTVQSAAMLRSLSQRPVLGSLGLHAGPRMRVQQRLQHVAFGGAFGALILVYAAWIAWLLLLGLHR